jgi:hypothetical protein
MLLKAVDVEYIRYLSAPTSSWVTFKRPSTWLALKHVADGKRKLAKLRVTGPGRYTATVNTLRHQVCRGYEPASARMGTRLKYVCVAWMICEIQCQRSLQRRSRSLDTCISEPRPRSVCSPSISKGLGAVSGHNMKELIVPWANGSRRCCLTPCMAAFYPRTRCDDADALLHQAEAIKTLQPAKRSAVPLEMNWLSQ